MKTRCRDIRPDEVQGRSKERFRFEFQRGLRRRAFGNGSVAEAFGAVWEKTLEEVPLDEQSQGQLYRELIRWAGTEELYTGPREQTLIQVWGHTVHEF
jgi:hypothetical protein